MTNIKKRNKILEIVAWVVALLLLVFAFVYYNFLAPTDDIMAYRVGDKCPDFTARVYDGTEEGGKFTLSEHEGKVVVVNFWATWCDPCVGEIPHFEELQKNYRDDVVVVAFHQTNPYGGEEAVQKFIDDPSPKKVSWTDYSMLFLQDVADIAVDVKKDSSALYKLLGGSNVWPMTVILNKQGKIDYVRQGSMDYTQVEENFLKVLNA